MEIYLFSMSIILGFLVGFLMFKLVIKRNAPGQLNTCKNCQYYKYFENKCEQHCVESVNNED